MAPISTALASTHAYTRGDGIVVYEATVDLEWSVFGSPHGGYLLALITTAIGQLQAGSTPYHPDPAHLTATFLRPAKAGKIEIRVNKIKTGRNWTNFETKLYQGGQPVILSQALYTLFPPLPTSSTPPSNTNQNLLPFSATPYAPLSPFLTHPSLCDPTPKLTEFGRRWSSDSVFWFSPSSMRWSEDPTIKAQREGSGKEDSLKLDWGAWCEFKNEEDVMTTAMLPFFSDMMSSIPELLPEGQKVEPHYYPTMAMSLHFHARLPLPAPYLTSPYTIGCFSTGKFIHEGRHEQLVEVWSAPGPIGVGETQDQWRSRSMCLVTSTQIALSVPVSQMKTRNAKRPEKL